MEKKKIMIIFGTRPEAIKMAPIVRLLKRDTNFETKVCVTAQHRQMLDQVMEIFGINADFDLNIMAPNQTLGDITCKVLKGMENILNSWHPDTVLVQGDTTTVFAAALAAFYQKIPVGHVEAGLRTFNKYSPFPEELNRCLATQLTTYHFAPTQTSKNNLIREGIDPENIFITGNTVIDALLESEKYLESTPEKIKNFEETFHFIDVSKKLILVTGHRRENFGEGFLNICKAIAMLAGRPDVQFIYPVHLNPNVQKPVNEILGHLDNVILIPPQDYLSFLYLMKKSYLILTDSGGVQEEAPSLGKPVIVMRDTTERPEAVAAGTALLSGADYNNIIKDVSMLLDDATIYHKMSQSHNPYGDGHASSRIRDVLAHHHNPQTTY